MQLPLIVQSNTFVTLLEKNCRNLRFLLRVVPKYVLNFTILELINYIIKVDAGIQKPPYFSLPSFYARCIQVALMYVYSRAVLVQTNRVVGNLAKFLRF